MFTRIARLINSFIGASAVAAAPLKAITGIVVSLIIPYLLYAFLGGFGIALALVALVWGIVWLKKKTVHLKISQIVSPKKWFEHCRHSYFSILLLISL